ncbi:alpha/beta hydrolase [Actinotalea fermentans]|uniref:alpha/beta hydrolase n=1 Tax=Actinotalea fermentans TaxID=43671 RepID=UPI001649A20A|nr:alpha/beta hydrolase-fold protein [Actinotalea fermentans]
MAGAAVALGTAVVATQAVAAEAPATDSWVTTTPEGYYRFTVAQATVEQMLGAKPSVLELEGNIGPAGTWSAVAMDPSGANYEAMWGPVPPGLYYYQYTATMADRTKISFRNPDSPVTVTSQPNWNTFFVPGPGVEWMTDVAEGGGTVSELAYQSVVTHEERTALVWTPADYQANPPAPGPGRGPGHGPGHGPAAKPLPVLYLLADEGQSAREWAELGRIPQVLDNLVAAGEIEPMVVVMADVNVADPRAELLRSLVPAVRDAYRVARDGRQQAVAGIGTGAGTALDLLVHQPGTFRSVGSLSGSLDDLSIRRPDAHRINGRTDLLRLYVGNVLDPAYNGTEALLRAFERAGVRHQFDGVDPDQGATWDTWREAVRDFASRVFTRGTAPGPRDGNLPLDEPYVAPATGSITTPHIDENGIVTFETGTQWADAKDVTVWANWAPNGAWFRIPMTKVDDRWRLALGPLDGFYYYRYVVDGVDVKDPEDTVNTLTGVSPLFVPGETDLLLADAPEADRGSVDVLTYASALTGTDRNAYVWTPPDYDPARAEPYPLFVLNHGGGQNWGDWVEVGRAPQILDNLYRQGEIEPMVVVMPDGNVSNYQVELRENVIPAVQAGYHVSEDPQERAIAGLSMGGMNSLATWLMYPGEFAYVGAFSGGLFWWPTVDAAAVNEGTTLARIYVGDVSDFAAGWVYGTMAGLDERGVEYEFAGPSVGPHGFDVWSANLIDLLPRLFQEAPQG